MGVVKNVSDGKEDKKERKTREKARTVTGDSGTATLYDKKEGEWASERRGWTQLQKPDDGAAGGGVIDCVWPNAVAAREGERKCKRGTVSKTCARERLKQMLSGATVTENHVPQTHARKQTHKQTHRRNNTERFAAATLSTLRHSV